MNNTNSLIKYGLRLNRFLISRTYPNTYCSAYNRQKRFLYTTPELEKQISFNLSDIGEGIRDVVVKEWYVKEGDVVQQFDNLCEVQSDKASVTITSRYDGKIIKIHKIVDEVALVGKPLLDFEVEDEDEDTTSTSSSSDSSSDESPKENQTEEATLKSKSKVLATPAVRRIAMEYKINLGEVPATGKLGRVLKGDVLEYLNLVPPGTNIPHPTLKTPFKPQTEESYVSPATAMEPVIADRVEALKGVRKAMLKSMTESQKIPHAGYTDEVNVTKLVELRNDLKPEAQLKGIKLTYMPFFVKAASLALVKFPIMNSTLDMATESVHYRAAHNISVAIASPEGLVVPNVKNCEKKNIERIALDLIELQNRAQKGQLRPEDFSNGTFSLSNIGIVGGICLNPCIMPPQVSIGAIGKIRILPRFDDNGNVIKAHIMNVSWSADHRVIDGITIAQFSETWKKYLENPNLFILNGY